MASSLAVLRNVAIVVRSPPDGAGGCPSGALAGGRERAAQTARRLSEEATSGADWANQPLGRYLQALAAWLDDSDHYYANHHRVRPSNAWEIINEALRAPTVYE